jgi:hypothetical protein
MRHSRFLEAIFEALVRGSLPQPLRYVNRPCHYTRGIGSPARGFTTESTWFFVTCRPPSTVLCSSWDEAWDWSLSKFESAPRILLEFMSFWHAFVDQRCRSIRLLNLIDRGGRPNWSFGTGGLRSGHYCRVSKKWFDVTLSQHTDIVCTIWTNRPRVG